MTRLYLRIFVSFWLVIILTIGVVVLVNSQLEHAQRDDTELSERAMRTAEGLTARAQAALDRGGPPALARWAAASEERGRRLSVYVFDAEGRELLQRAPPREVRTLRSRWLDVDSAPQPYRRGQFVTTISHRQHGRFLIVLSPPPRPWVLRLLGPLGLSGLVGLAVLFSGLTCLVLARHITHPIQQLRRAGQALGRGDLAARVPATASRRGDELGDLARDFNRMAERLQGLIGTQRQLLRDVSHELRSPLARLQVSLALAADSEGERRATHLQRMEIEIGRLDHLIGEILSFARLSEANAPELETFDLMDLVTDIAESARVEGAPRQVTVEVDGPNQATVSADVELLQRAVENVVRNAIRHTPEGSTVVLRVDRGTDKVLINVVDQGPGVPDERLDDIFDPFVRLSPERSEAGSGGGVGLAIARAALERHGGHIHAANRADGGLCITLVLPVRQGSA